MPDRDDIELLRDYAIRGSEAAFETIVSRRVRFVYAAALRQVRDPHMAEEVTQAVFIILAQKAASIPEKTILTGWLFKTTRFVALAQTRALARRRQYEQEAHLQTEPHETGSDALWEQLSPFLDGGLAHLGAADRQALLLRFFEDKSFAEVGRSLGAGEDSARMRVNRALEKLRKYFLKRGVAIGTTALASLIAAHQAQAEPAYLAKTIAAASLARGATASDSTLTLIKGALKIMAWTKAKTTVVVGIIALCAVGTTTVTVHKVRAHREYVKALDAWRIPRFDPYSTVANALPQTRILPTKFKPPVYGKYWSPPAKWAGVRVPVGDMVSAAYGWPLGRIVFPDGEPQERYDFASTLPVGADDAFKLEIKKTLGLVVRHETKDMDVWVLKVRNLNGTGLKPHVGQDFDFHHDIRGYIHCFGLPLSASPGEPVLGLTKYLEKFTKMPVIDETGLTNRYDLDLTWKEQPESDPTHEAMRKALVDQLGLELVADHQPVEMLVVEKVK